VRSPWIGLVACALLAACGGGTPDPKTEEEAAPTMGGGHKDKDADKGKDKEEPAAEAPASEAPAPAPAASSKPTTELKAPKEDDVWMAAHQLPPGDVLKTMRPQQGKVHACFSAGVKRDPSTSGEVKVRFVITNEGAVRAYKDDGSTMTDADVTKCVGDLLQKLKFPKQKSPGDAWGTYTANFSH
jgi:hypothetical protein